MGQIASMRHSTRLDTEILTHSIASVKLSNSRTIVPNAVSDVTLNISILRLCPDRMAGAIVF